MRGQNWELLESHGLFSAIVPGYSVPGGGRPGWASFPAFWGKLGKMNRHKGALKNLQEHTAKTANTSAENLRLDYIQLFGFFLSNPLALRGKVCFVLFFYLVLISKQ